MEADSNTSVQLSSEDEEMFIALMNTVKNRDDRLHLAARFGSLHLMNLLLIKGADVNMKDKNMLSPLHIAANFGHLPIVELLLNKEAEVNMTNNDFSLSPLHCAANSGHLNIVKLLLNKGADVNTIDKNMLSPLHYAANSGHQSIIELLLNEGAEVNMKNNDFSLSPLHCAVNSGCLSCVKLLLNRGADLTIIDMNNLSPLHYSLRCGDPQIVGLLLDKVPDLNIIATDYWSPLHCAIRFGHLPVVELLFNKYTDLTIIDKNDWSPLHYAIRFGHIQIVELLLNKCADVNIIDKDNGPLLHYAIRFGHLPIVELLLNKGADVNIVLRNVWPPLHYAINIDNLPIIELLLSKVADVNMTNSDFRFSPLHCAAHSGNINVVELLLEKGADISMKNRHDESPLHFAIESGHEHIVELLLDKGADAIGKDNDGYTPLHCAAKLGQTGTVKLLLRNGVDINTTDNKGWSPLHSAAISGQLFMVKHLIMNGADINKTDYDGWSPLHMAALTGQLAILELLLAYADNAKIIKQNDKPLLHRAAHGDQSPIKELRVVTTRNIYNGSSLLHSATVSGDLSILELLLNKGADVNISDDKRVSVLHCAAKYGRLKILLVLLDHGADINIKDKDGSTPLHYATKSGHLSIVEILTTKGAETNMTDKCGWSPLHCAANSGHPSIAELLLLHGANLSLTDKEGRSPLHCAASSDHTTVAELLLNNGADISLFDNHGRSPFHYATKCCNLRTVQLMLENGADVNVTFKQGNTPLHYAARSGDESLVNLLLDNGINVNVSNLHGDTPLHWAVKSAKESVVKLLVKKGANVTGTKTNCDTPLHLAVKHCGADTIELLLNKGANINMTNEKGELPLHEAVRRGKEYVNMLLTQGSDVDAANEHGDTPLLLAVKHRGISTVKLLLNSGANAKTTNAEGEFLLHVAVRRGNEYVNLLLTKYINVNMTNNHGDTPLHAVVKHGKISTIKLLLNIGANLNMLNKDGKSPLHYAIERGSLAVFELLLKNGADVHKMENNGNSLLHLVAERGNESFINLLLNNGVNVNSRNEHGDTPLHYAVNFDEVGAVKLLLKKSADVHLTNNDGNSPLHLAVRYGNMSVITLLLDNGAVVSTTNKNGKSPLHYATHRADESIVTLLLNNGADIDTTDNDGNSPLHLAIRHGNVNTIQLLLNKGANVILKNKHSEAPLYFAVERGGVAIVNQLLRVVENLASTDKNGNSFLHVACERANEPMISLLLRQGFDVNSKNEDEDTPLHFAVKFEHDYIAELLLSKGADVNAINKKGHSPLIEAMKHCEASIIQLLLNYNAKVDTSSEDGKSPLHYAAQRKEEIIMKLLLQKGADVDATDDDGNSPMHLAAKYGAASTVILLINKGANLNAKNKYGETMLHYAAERGDTTIVDLLLQKGAIVDMTDHNGSTPLHQAVLFNGIWAVSLLLLHGADVTQKNMAGDTPLTVANLYHFEKNKEMAHQLQNAEKSLTANSFPPRAIDFITRIAPYCDLVEIPKQRNQKKSYLPKEHWYSKHCNTSGMCGQLYESKLLTMVLLRALNDEHIEDFLLGSNIDGMGDMDDICLRYRVKDHQKPVILFVQAKHRDDTEKKRLTVEKLWRPGSFSFQKYFESFLTIKDRFQSDTDDPMFKGDFDDVECNLVIYTPLKEYFTKKKSQSKINNLVHSLINTEHNYEAFQYEYHENDIERLVDMTVRERFRKLGVTFFKYISNKCEQKELDGLIMKYNVIMAREVLQESKANSQINKKYRLWEFRPEFFESNCKYLISLKKSFIEELSAIRLNIFRTSNHDIVNSCASINHGLQTILEYFTDDSNVDITNQTIQETLLSMVFKLPLSFGNLDMIFGNDNNVQEIIKTVADKVVILLKMYEDTKIVDINDNIVGPGKIIEYDVIDIIGTAVGNLLILDVDNDMFKFDMDNDTLPENAVIFFNELKHTRYKPINEKLSSYRFKINIDRFPQVHCRNKYNKEQAKVFFNNLWIYCNQAKQDKVESITKCEINKNYNYNNNRVDQIPFIVNAHDIFLEAHNEMQNWWKQTDKARYLNQTNDFFALAKQNFFNSIVTYVRDTLNNLGINQFNTQVLAADVSAQINIQFYTAFHELFIMLDTVNKSIDFKTEVKKDIVDVLLTSYSNWRLSNGINDQGSLNFNLRNTNTELFDHKKRAGTSGVRGHLYVTKLLCLVLLRGLNDKKKDEKFFLGNSIRDIGAMNDVSLRYKKNDQQKPIVLFMLAKHKENTDRRTFTVENAPGDSDDLTLQQLFESYLTIKERFRGDADDPMFKGAFDDVECNFVIHTPAKSCISKKKTDHKINETLHYLINTRHNSEILQYDHDETDIEILSKITVYEELKILGVILLDLFMSEKDNIETILGNKLIVRYHVVVAQQILRLQNNGIKANRDDMWEFRPDFFKSNCEYIVNLKRILIKELSTKRYDKSKVSNQDIQNLLGLVKNDTCCASSLSLLIGKLVTYNDKNKSIQLIEFSGIKKKLIMKDFFTVQERLNNIKTDENIISQAITLKLSAMKIKLPLWFGNVDMTFRGSDSRVRKRMAAVANKIINLLETCKDTNILSINDDMVGPGKTIEKGFLEINGGIGGAVGNLLFIDFNTNMLKFDVNSDALPNNARAFLEELNDVRFKSVNENLRNYRMKINIKEFPKTSFQPDDYDKIQARDFFSKLWFYTNQAKEDEIENLLKDEIGKYYDYKIGQNDNKYGVSSHSIYLRVHNAIQAWSTHACEVPYLSRVSELLERAELADIYNILMNIINYLHRTKTFKIDLLFKQCDFHTDVYGKWRQIFSQMSSCLFKMFIPQFDQHTELDEVLYESNRYAILIVSRYIVYFYS